MNATTATPKGILYIVATPIGNRLDITLRALETLKIVDYIASEDTRHSRPLLEHYAIKKPLISCHDHNENIQSKKIITDLLNGKNIALISDAGTPLISDPGYLLVKLARENEITITPIPGACALVTALSACGVSTETFTFYGFLSSKSQKRVNELNELSSIYHTLIFYESSHRIIHTISDIGKVFAQDTQIILAKELTKTFETFISGNYTNILNWLESDPKHTKGEFVIIIAPRSPQDKPGFAQTLEILLNELPLKQAVKITSLITKHKKNTIYEYAINKKP